MSLHMDMSSSQSQSPIISSLGTLDLYKLTGDLGSSRSTRARKRMYMYYSTRQVILHTVLYT